MARAKAMKPQRPATVRRRECGDFVFMGCLAAGVALLQPDLNYPLVPKGCETVFVEEIAKDVTEVL